MKTIKEIRDSKGIVETSVGDSVSYNSETKTITVINGYHPGNQFVVTDEQLKNNFEDIYFRRAGRGKKIKITTEGPKLVSFWDIYGKELEVKDTKTVNFASGPKTFYITEFEGREYEVPEDMVEKSIPNNYDGKSVQEVWDSLTPKQREHFITDHFNEINANGNFGTSISLSNMVENLSYNGTNNEGISLPVEVKRSFTKHVSSGQYGKGKKVDLGTAVKGEFTTDGENYFSGWYFESQDWNGFKVPYFEDKEAREVIESLEGLSVGRLYGGKLSDKGWWYAEPGTAPADRTVITGQKIQTTDGEKEVWSIGGFEWTWSLKDEQAGDGAKIEKMENKYYYLKPKALFKDSGGVTFEITGHTPTSLKARRFSEVEKNTPEIEIPYEDVLELAGAKKMNFHAHSIDKIREFRHLDLEIEYIKLGLKYQDAVKTYQAELEQAKSKIENLSSELTQVKTEANALMEDLGKKSAGFKDSLDAMEAIARKDKAGKGKEVEVGEASVYVELINGNIKVYHGADFKAKEKPYFLLKIKNAKPGSWDKIWDALRKIKSGNPKDGGVASIYIELSKGNITVYHGSSFELTGSKNELLSRDGVVEGSWLKIWEVLDGIKKASKAGNGKEVEAGEASVYVELINGNFKVYHGADFKAKDKPYFLFKIKNAKNGSWDKIWDALRKIKSGNPKEGGAASLYIELSKGNITVYHGSSFELTGSKNELLSREGAKEGSWLKIWDALIHIKKASKAGKGKEVGDSQVDYFIEKFKDKMSGSSKSSALGWLDVPELSSREKMTVWNKIQPYISKEQDPAFIPENWTKYKWFNNKASKGAQVSDFKVGDLVVVELSRFKDKPRKLKTGTIESVLEKDELANIKMANGEVLLLSFEEFKLKNSSKGTQVSPCTDCDTKLKAFIAKFPNNAKSWAQATDEMRDLARELREYYNEENDLSEGDKGYIDGLPFREFKTPSEWNTKAKKQILSTWKKLDKEQKEYFASNNSFLNPDND